MAWLAELNSSSVAGTSARAWVKGVALSAKTKAAVRCWGESFWVKNAFHSASDTQRRRRVDQPRAEEAERLFVHPAEERLAACGGAAGGPPPRSATRKSQLLGGVVERQAGQPDRAPARNERALSGQHVLLEVAHLACGKAPAAHDGAHHVEVGGGDHGYLTCGLTHPGHPGQPGRCRAPSSEGALEAALVEGRVASLGLDVVQEAALAHHRRSRETDLIVGQLDGSGSAGRPRLASCHQRPSAFW